MQQNRGYLADPAMGYVLVVVPAPMLQFFRGICKAHEPVGIQAFGPELAVERFDKGIVGRLARPAEVQRHAVGKPKGPDRAMINVLFYIVALVSTSVSILNGLLWRSFRLLHLAPWV
jgi:hypothetical protein